MSNSKNIDEDYVIEQTTKYYNGIKELANDTMNNLQSYDVKNDDLELCKDKINYILNMENGLKEFKTKLKLLNEGIPVEQLTASLDLRNKNKDLFIEQIKEKLQQNDNNK